MVVHFSRLILVSLLALGAVILETYALTSSELKSWAVNSSLVGPQDLLATKVSRADAAPLYLSTAGLYWGTGAISSTLASTTNSCILSDVRSESQISDACKLGIIRGMGDGRFYPENNLTPAQAMVILMRIVGGRQDEQSTPWWSNYMTLATKHGIVPETDRALITSGTSITKEKILSWIYNAKNSATLKADPRVASASVAMFGSAGFLDGTAAPVTATASIAPVVVPLPVTAVAAIAKVDMNQISMTYDSWNCDSGAWYCKWLGLGGHSSASALMWWILAFIIVWWILCELWRWLCGCGDTSKKKNADVYTAHKSNMVGSTSAAKKSALKEEKKVAKSPSKTTKGAGVVSIVKDDLKIVEGIGPKVEKILHDADVYTYADLARMSPVTIKAILDPHGMPYSNMSTDTWPDQAKLARDGKMKELEVLKKKLNAGRKA